MEALNYDLERTKKQILRKYPAFGSVIANAKFIPNNNLRTAATDGKNVYFNEKYFSSLSESEQVFVLSHEVGHIALNHIQRSKNKDARLWNIACDGVINQYLQNDGLQMPKGGIDIKEALEYDAEELYEALVNRKNELQNSQNNQSGLNGNSQSDFQQEKSQNSRSGNSNQDEKHEGSNNQNKLEENDSKNGNPDSNNKSSNKQNNHSSIDDLLQDDNEQVGHDDHSMWQQSAEKWEQEEESQEEKQNKDSQTNEENKENEEKKFKSEKEAFDENEKEKERRANEIVNELNNKRRGFTGDATRKVSFGELDKAKPVTNWKKILKHTLEIEDERWGHRFSDRDNGYRARIEDCEYDEKGETEIILDVSGSVSEELLKNFLRQMKTLLKDTDIKVATFSDDVSRWTYIKKETDIDNLKFYIGGLTNFDAASRAFTKRPDVNKIVFTDGQDGGDARIQEKRKDIVWITFENPNFKPDYGKVIYVPESEIYKFVNEDEMEK